VVANQFIIRDVIKGSDDFMYSPNLWEVAERAGLWSPSQGSLDFLKTYGPQRMHSPYATRRVWRVFTLLDPTLDLPAETDSYASNYPFSVKPTIKGGKIDKHDLMRLQRDHYEGSAYDLTKGLQGGPYGDPERWDASPSDEMSLLDVLQGSFERAISLFRTSYSFVAVSRKHLPDTVGPVMWFTQYAPASSSYTPFYVSATDAPRPYTHGSLFKYDPSVSFWNFAAAGNWANRWYLHSLKTVQDLQYNLESGYARELNSIDDQATAIYKNCEAAGKDCDQVSTQRSVVGMLTAFSQNKGQQTVDAWRDLLPTLITQFHDGYHAQNLDGTEIQMKKLFYPKWWLDAVGYFENKPNTDPKAIMFAPAPASVDANTADGVVNTFTTSGVMATVLICSALSVVAGFVVGRRMQRQQGGYQVIGGENDLL
jgi:dipeptidase